jgi:hypothetical protein
MTESDAVHTARCDGMVLLHHQPDETINVVVEIAPGSPMSIVDASYALQHTALSMINDEAETLGGIGRTFAVQFTTTITDPVTSDWEWEVVGFEDARITAQQLSELLTRATFKALDAAHRRREQRG